MGIYQAICQRFAKPIRGKNERYGIPILQIWGLEVFTVKGSYGALDNAQVNSSELKHWQSKNVFKTKKELFVQDTR